MFKTTLYFPSFEVLCQFRRILTFRDATLYSKLNVLIAELTEGEIRLACDQHDATVVRKQGAGKVVAHHTVGLKEAV